MKQKPAMKQGLRYQIAACPKCGSRKKVSWAPCDICGSVVVQETHTIPLVEENGAEPSFTLDIRLVA